MFLVPAKSPGIEIVETWDQLGLRASGSHDVLLNNVAIPADYAVDIRRPKEWAERSARARARAENARWEHTAREILDGGGSAG